MTRTFPTAILWFRSDNRKSAGLSVIAFVLVAAGAVAQAQQPTKIPRIGWLTGGFLSSTPARQQAFRQGLSELGYVEGKNILIEWCGADNIPGRSRALAEELVRLKVDVIVTASEGQTRTAKEATSTIPIVMASSDDPVGNGLVASLARPGGNITGLSQLSPELSGKRLEILKEVLPKLSRLAVFGTSSSVGQPQVMKEIERAAAAFGVKLQYLDVLTTKDIEPAFREAVKGRADAVLEIIAGNIRSAHRKELAELAVKHRLPVMRERPEHAEAGGLMSYGVNLPDLDRRAATHVDKILKGAKPAEIPVEQATKFEFIINLKAAKQIGLTIPPNVLARADRVIK
ncbi:MAG TPA: ABC transporter substrate-binding protein [Candidatus Binatia bacterium]|jgi:putative ABC transport system substrate-binding protein|nr:ABC transporter substrate-binding protein [Candidatus Binatia bacterium]